MVNILYTVVCKTSGTGFRAIYSPYRQAILLKNFMNKLNSAENFSTKLGAPSLERLPIH
jgi:hypothetical protein